MKTLLLLITLTFVAVTTFGQSYIPIPDTLAVWRQSFYASEMFDKYQIYTAEKTTIDSFVYTVLRKTGNSNYYGTANGYTDTLFGFFRNDTLNRKVFFRSSLTDTADGVLYDFTLNVGDTIPSTWLGNNYLNIIDSVDTVWMYGQPRRRLSFIDYSFIPGAEGAIIEGIGSLHGFAEQLTVPLEPMWYQLECFSYKDSAYSFSWHNLPPQLDHPIYSGSSCWLYSEIKETEKQSLGTPSPNPFSDKLTLVVTANKQTTISLYNFIGQQVLQQTFANSTTINTEQLADGIYFYELRNENGTIKTGKVVKQ
ncbi:MAG: T9SS type A sorting domain-containing protein [Bacteroidota bacterium]